MPIRRLINAMAIAHPVPASPFPEGIGARAFAMAIHRVFSRAAGNETEARASSFEPTTIEALFRRHVDDVHRMVARLLGPAASRADIEDLTQQVFLAAHRALADFRGDSKPSTWLYGIATRTVLTHLRSRRRHKRLVERLESETFAPLPVPTDSAEAQLDRREELRTVWTCLMNINPKKRMVFMLHELEGLSGKEIAEALEIKEATVWTRLYHARKELLEAMRKAGKERR